MSAEGGEHETVEMFVLEAYEASVVLKLYEAAFGPTANVPAIKRFMSVGYPPTIISPPIAAPESAEVPQRWKRSSGRKTTS